MRIYGYISIKKKLSSLPYFVFIMYHDYIVYLMNCFVYYLCKHILYYVLYYFERRNKSKQTNKQSKQMNILHKNYITCHTYTVRPRKNETEQYRCFIIT